MKYKLYLICTILLFLGTSLSYAQCPEVASITPQPPSCRDGNDGTITVSLSDLTGDYNIQLYQEISGFPVPVSGQSFTNQTANPFVFTGLVPYDKYIVFVSFVGVTSPCEPFIFSNSIDVINPPAFMPTVGGEVTICEGGSGNLSASGAVSYTWSPTDFLDDPTSATPTASPPTTTTYTVTAVSAAGCVGTATQTVTVTPVPTITFNLSETQLCESAAPLALNASPSGGSFSGSGVSGSSFNPSAAGVGTHPITYTFTQGGCSVSETRDIEVTPTPTVSFTLPFNEICVSAAPLALTASPSGGSFSGNGVSGSSFNPSAAGVGTHTLTYSYTENNCTVTQDRTIEVFADPTLSISGLLSDICVGSSPFTVTVVPTGGTLSGPGISGNTFDPIAAGVGTHTITYEYEQFNCTYTITETVAVRNGAAVSITNLDAVYCLGTAAFTLTASPSGGTFSGSGVSGNTFDPDAAGIGTHIITYTYNDANCTSVIQQSVEVRAAPTVTFDPIPTEYCESAPALSLSASPSGGTFAGDGVSGNTFDPAVAGVGNYTISYTVVASGCTITETQNIEVTAAPTLAITNLEAAYCIDAGTVTLTATPTGGTFSGDGVSGNTFDPTVAGIGTHTITYSFTENGCTITEDQTVEVTALPTVSFSGLAGPYCEGSGAITLMGNPTGGSFSGPGISGNTFDPAVAGVGTHTITYTYTENGCTVTTTESVEVNVGNTPLTIHNLDANYCVNAPSVTITGDPSGGTFSGPGVSGNTFDPNAAGVGTHTITYEYVDGGCTSSVSQTVTVTDVPTVTLNVPLNPVCVDAGTQTLSATPSGGIFTGNGISSNTFDPIAAGVGTHTITYTYEENGCTIIENVATEVTPTPTLSFDGLATTYCDNETSVALAATPSGGTFTGTGVTGTTFDPSAAGLGMHTITYTYEENGCTEQISQDVEVVFCDPCAGVTITADLDITQPASCGDLGELNVSNVAGGTSDYTYSLDGSTFQTDASFTDLADGSYTLTIQDAIGCTATFNFDIDAVTPLTITDFTVHPVTCAGDMDGSIQVDNVTGGSGNYEYSLDGGTFQAAPLFENLSGGTYTLEVRDEGSCSATLMVDVDEPAALSFDVNSTFPSDCGQSDGTLTISNVLGGNGGYTYSIDGTTFESNTTFSGLAEGNYTVYVRDSEGCEASQSIDITFPNDLSATIIPVQGTCGSDNGQLIVDTPTGGSSDYEYSLDGVSYQAAPLFTGLAEGNYTVYLKDANGACFVTYPVALSAPSVLTANVQATAASNCTNPNGQITVSDVTGGVTPFAYRLNGGTYQSAPLFNNLAPGNYTVFVRDATSCEASFNAVVDAPVLPSITNVNITAPDCTDPASGSIVVTQVVGGVAPYTYSLDGVNFQVSATFDNLASGLYNVTVRDAGGCTQASAQTVPTATTLNFSVVQLTPSSCGFSNGSAEAQNVTGGSGTYFYSLDDVTYQNSPRFENIAEGTYTMYVKDASFDDCVFSRTFVIDGTAQLSYEAENRDIGCSAAAGQIQVSNIVGGTLPYTISLTGSTTTSVTVFLDNHLFEDLSDGTYTVRITDSNNCESRDTTLSISSAEPILANVNTTLSLIDEATGTITISAIEGGLPPYQISIDGGATFYAASGVDTTFQQVNIGTYQVVIKDRLNCSVTYDAIVEESTFLIPNLVTPNADGKNDLFFIRNLPNTGSYLKISSRSGKVIYENDNYQNDWNGGENPDGIYFYLLRVPELGDFTGWVQVWR